MHHPNQFQTEAKIRQQELLQQAAAHRAAKEANQGASSWANWLFWPGRLMMKVLRLIHYLRRPAPDRELELEDATLALDRK